MTPGRGIDDVDIAELFQRSPRPMVVADDERRCVDANQAAVAMLRVGRRELLTLRVDDLAAPDQRDTLDDTWRRFLSAGTLTSVCELHLPGGRRLQVDVSAVAHVGPHRHMGICVPVRGSASAGELVVASGSLSAREREVMRMVAHGADGPEIAEALVLSPATVRTHVNNAMRKLGARTRAHAITLAIRRGDVDL
ncbi:MAG TPA: LuxR C-terminal-related transcriptional regulator [Solirubrobacteraceae bacterium]|nr:LuxR C-terminal-related transcriptional regulator [Solirubrobacteraceae bacterium]